MVGGLGSTATDINRYGDVVGNITSGATTNGFVYTSSGYAVLGTLGGLNTFSNAIKDYGVVVGSASTLAGNTHAYVYSGGSLHDLGTLGGSVARDINKLGQVVGTSAVSLTPDTYGYHGFLYDGAGGMVDLNTLIDPASGSEITDAHGINGARQIAATACHGGMFGDCNAVRLDLVSAVPEPGGWAMLVFGLGALAISTLHCRNKLRAAICCKKGNMI